MSDTLDDLLASMRTSALDAPAPPSVAPFMYHGRRGTGGLDRDRVLDGDNYEVNLPSGESFARVQSAHTQIPLQVETADSLSEGDGWTAISEARAPSQKRKPALPASNASPMVGVTGGKLVSVVRLAGDLDIYARICRSFVGKSNVVCVRMDCSIAHRADGLAGELRPGDLLVAKVPGQTVHVNPRIASEKLESGLIGDWLSSQETLESWVTLFARAAEAFSVGDGTKTTSAAAVDAIRMEEEKAVRFRTPKKPRRSSSDMAADVGLSPYSLTFQNGQEEFASQTEGEKVDRLVEAVINIDHGLSTTADYAMKLGRDVSELRTDSMLAARALETNVRLNKRSIGERPQDLPTELDGVTIWGTISQLAEKVGADTPADRDTEISEVRSSIGKVAIRAEELEEKLVRSVSAIRGAVVEIQAKVVNNVATGHPSGADTSMELRLSKAEKNISAILAESKEATIKFNGLGLDGASEAAAWLETNLPSGSIGYVVDPHTVLEHIHKELNGASDFLKEFERADNLKIPDPQFALAMTSFTSPIPKVFSKGNQLVVKNDASYFDLIPNWESWDFPETGQRASLRGALVAFEESHKSNIENELDSECRAYQLAVASLSSSVAFVESIIQFIDDYVKHLTLAKFSNKRAFHVTTRLAKRILLEVYKPRMGVAKTFKTGVKGVDVIAQKIFWASMQSLDIAMEIRRVGIMEHHLVASELVKFLAVNTGIEAIEKLQTQVDQGQKTIQEAAKAAKEAGASAKTTANQLVDKLAAQTRLIEGLQRRLKALEDKK